MTREEALNVLLEIRPCIIDNAQEDALDIAIDVLSEPSLPSNLDEAAEEYVKTTSVKVWGRINPEKDFEGYMARANYGTGLLDGFKAGAKWMAEQG